jgi:hypothetical protein
VFIGPLLSTGHDADHIENIFCIVGRVYRALHSNGRYVEHKKRRSCIFGRVCVAGVAQQWAYESKY